MHAQTRTWAAAKGTLFYLSLIVLALGIVFPFIWMVLASLKTQVQIMDMQRLFVFRPTMDNYRQVFTEYSFTKPLFNSLVIALASTLLGLLLGLPAAYSIARFRLRSRKSSKRGAHFMPSASAWMVRTFNPSFRIRLSMRSL